MCGIAGAVSRRHVDAEILERMRDLLVHRGPDAAGSWASEDGRACLVHRRLAIIDPTPDADQPFVSGDGRYAVTLNGEIYNFRSLRAELEQAGASFRTRSDTEVLLEAYRHYGERCLDHISGMFAFAIWDEERRTLFCARDRAGEKPFYYAVIGDAFVFASELKALLCWPGFRRELDPSALVDFLTFGFVPDPKSIWVGASKLPPAHTLTVELNRDLLRVQPPRPYWDLVFDPDGSVEDWGSCVRESLIESAREMSYADVPVGAFLSGGIDSSSVTAALTYAGHDVRTFTIGFEDADFDERRYARKVAAAYGSHQTERTVRADDVETVFRDAILWHYDEPFADYSYLPTYYVCREARESITVALTGDGGDELFAGYGKYTLLARRRAIHRALTAPGARALVFAGRLVAPESLGKRLRPYEVAPDELLLSTLVTGTPPAVLRAAARGSLAQALSGYDPADAVAPHLRRTPPAEVGLVNAMRYLDLKLTLGAGILTKVDRAAMAVSLETRPVYLNRRILELAGRIPARLLADGTEAKKVLRRAFRPWLPPSILDRPKMGFAMPLGRWLRGDLRTLTDQLSKTALDEFIDPRFTANVVSDHLADAAQRTAELHNLVFLGHWLDTWVTNPRPLEPSVR